MAQLAVDDEDGGELDEAEVVAGPLLGAGQEAPEAVEPAVADLHHPSPRRVAIRGGGRWERPVRAHLGRDVRGIAPRRRLVPARCVVVPPVQDELWRASWGGLNHGRVEEVSEFLHVVAARSGDHDRDRDPLRLGQGVALGARFSPIGGVSPGGLGLAGTPFLPNGASTMHPSAACQSQSRPTSASYARSNTAQARSRAPVPTHSVNRSWTVDLGPKRRGSSLHWLPVRASQISPSKMARSSRRGRPSFLRGLSTRRTGPRSANRASSTSQIV